MSEDQVRDMFSAAADGELPSAEQSAFDQALAADLGLAAEYHAFTETLKRVRSVGRAPAPNLLPAIQKRLRARSRGRYYADRFAERRGTRLMLPLILLMLTLALFAVATLGLRMLDAAVSVDGKPAQQHGP